MDLSKILAISGKSGLFSVISQTKTGLIVESIEDGKKFPVFINDRSSALEDISVFTIEEDLPLIDVFKKIFEKENGKNTIDHKSDKNELLQYFETVLPDYDKDRVYVSDIKKIISWYNLLVNKKIMEFKEEKKAETKAKTSGKDSSGKEKPAKSPAKKDKPAAKTKSVAKPANTKVQKAQPAKGGSAKNKGIGVKQK